MDPLTLPATLDALGEIGRYVNQAAAAAGLEKQAAYNLRLAVDEIATNIILHGYEEAGLSGDIRVMREESAKELRITLEDRAIPFDPRGKTLPSAEELARPLEERPIGGLGIFLVLNGVDRFDYQRQGEINRNIFIMRRPT